MRNPFTRQDQDAERPAVNLSQPDTLGSFSRNATPPSADRPVRADIAEIELMGQCAVATFTVTELSQEEGAEQLADLLQQMSESGALHFVLDVQSVQFMDTTCLGCMVQALNRLAARGGNIALANPNHSVHYIFRLTRLDRVFRICSDVMAALEAVEGKREAG